MFESGWFWGACALTVFWALGAYNRLVRNRAQVAARYAELMGVLNGMTELAQQTLSDAVTDVSLQRPHADASHIAACWRRLSAASTQASVALARMQEHCLLPQSVEDLNRAWQVFEATWDELKVSPWGLLPESVRQQWHEQRLLSQPLRRAFNLTVEQYNAAIAQWPASMVAHVFHFNPALALQESA
jgi:LemA protein